MDQNKSGEINQSCSNDNCNDEQFGPDGRADALSAAGLILFTVAATVFWIANQ